jgi:large conductance mechanosensitive channel
MIDIRQKGLSLVQEFRNFALKGNVIDLAIGVIIGAAFGKIIDSLVKHVLMPLIGLVLPGTDELKTRVWEVGGQRIEWGLFLSEVINFVIVALALFLFIVKFLNWVMRTKKEQPPPPPTKEQELLTEIRDLLKKQAAA